MGSWSHGRYLIIDLLWGSQSALISIKESMTSENELISTWPAKWEEERWVFLPKLVTQFGSSQPGGPEWDIKRSDGSLES